jgi:2-oxoglutarate ferredoxin oxidoreductase subunit gamma
MDRTELRISGFGGQGVILAAYVLGKACAVVENGHATLNQSFGPEARGSACSAQLILSGEPVTYPYVRSIDIKPDGLVLIDEDLVTTAVKPRHRILGVPATRIAEDLGRRIVANMVMVGFFAASTDLLQVHSVREAIASSVPSGTEDVNLAAFEAGFDFGQRKVRHRHGEEVTA